nr:repeat-containing protein WDC146 [Ipomoea trifida]
MISLLCLSNSCGHSEGVCCKSVAATTPALATSANGLRFGSSSLSYTDRKRYSSLRSSFSSQNCFSATGLRSSFSLQFCFSGIPLASSFGFAVNNTSSIVALFIDVLNSCSFTSNEPSLAATLLESAVNILPELTSSFVWQSLATSFDVAANVASRAVASSVDTLMSCPLTSEDSSLAAELNPASMDTLTLCPLTSEDSSLTRELNPASMDTLNLCPLTSEDSSLVGEMNPVSMDTLTLCPLTSEDSSLAAELNPMFMDTITLCPLALKDSSLAAELNPASMDTLTLCPLTSEDSSLAAPRLNPVAKTMPLSDAALERVTFLSEPISFPENCFPSLRLASPFSCFP